MRILAVKQPWATLLVLGHKPVENRTWSTYYRGDVAIHASQKADTSDGAFDMLRRFLPSTAMDRLPMGQIIGLVELYDVTRRMDSIWFHGPVGLLVRNARQLRRGITNRGMQSMIDCPAALREQILHNL